MPRPMNLSLLPALQWRAHVARGIVTRHLLALASLGALVACDPGIKTFDVTPAQLSCPGQVTLAWQAQGDGLHLDADQPVTPALPAIVTKQGSRTEHVSKTTTFTAYYPGAAHREKSVQVGSATCPGGSGSCGPQTLTFTGTCSGGVGPSYVTQSLSAAAAPGNITQIVSDADFPVHVQHDAATIPLGAGGGPIGPLPVVAAAGSYTISVPGQVGAKICEGGPVGGGGPAPTVHITVTPTCPK